MWLLLIIFFISGQRADAIEDLHFLEGTWKVEGSEQYESWEINETGLSGYMYIITTTGKEKQETLAIKTMDNQIVYEATVPDQNEGRTIRFTLNKAIKNCFSFENPKHDFPKKIQYEKKSEKEILVRVINDMNKGFTFKMIKQDQK